MSACIVGPPAFMYIRTYDICMRNTFHLQILPNMINSGILKNVWQIHMEIHHFKHSMRFDPWFDKMKVSRIHEWQYFRNNILISIII